MFKQVGAVRAAYHGGAFTGVDLRKIMNNADKLFQKGNGIVRMFLLERSPDDDVKCDTNKIYDDVCHTLKLWDGAFSCITKIDPDRNWRNKTTGDN